MAIERIHVGLLLSGYCLIAICTGASPSTSVEPSTAIPTTGFTHNTTHLTTEDKSTRASNESSTTLNHTTTATTREPAVNVTGSSTNANTHVSPGHNESGVTTSYSAFSPGGTNTTIQSLTYSSAITTISSATETRTSLNGTISPQAKPISKGLAQNPGLVAVLCIFISILVIAMVVLAVKFCHRREPEFQKLDEVPMNNMHEEAPFAHYPPK